MLVSSLPNIRYLTGFSGSNALLLVTPGQLILITDFRYETQVTEEVYKDVRVHIEQTSLWSALWEILKQARVKVVAFESSHTIHRDFARFTVEDGGGGGLQWQWRPTVDVVEKLRESKDEDEINLIKKAADIAVKALAFTLTRIRPGLTELQVAGILEKALRDEGSEGYPFPSIVASGARAALPHARTSKKVVESGDLLLLDFGAEYAGYCSDITRTVAVGKPSQEQQDIYNVVRVANERAAAGVRAGMSGKDADAIARDYIEGHGFGREFGHGLGHGVGLEVHEAPRLSRTSEGILPENAVVTIEPGIYRAGWGGIRIEDDVVLSSGGPVILTDFTRELITIS